MLAYALTVGDAIFLDKLIALLCQRISLHTRMATQNYTHSPFHTASNTD